VLVSEVMLQQTQVERVRPYYQRFLAAFPTPESCARAGSAAVIRLWSGLGYNRRALNLHRAAVAITDGHAGSVPHARSELLALPGVGAYTARAVQAFAFEEAVAPVDTNVVRILARCWSGTPLTVAQAQVVADRLVPADRAWDFTQAMFDLGSIVCTPVPHCAACPLRRQCRWRTAGAADPDPWRVSPVARPQSPFGGSDRQGRGRLLRALGEGSVSRGDLPRSCGWPQDRTRAERVAEALVVEGFARWAAGPEPSLELC
jgi:A/G-specific adenine glycosylase